MNIEQAATNAIESIILRNPYLTPFIESHDKTPSWDGFINVYNTKNPKHPNDSFEGRVPLQIKGKDISIHKKSVEVCIEDIINYRIRKNDLNAFKSEGGAIFFVVLIDKKYNTKIYFKELLSLDIERALKELKEKDIQSLSMNFEVFPNKEDDIANIFFNFIRNRKKQLSTVDKQRLYFNDWENCNDIESYIFSYTTVEPKKRNPYEVISKEKSYVYAKLKNFDIEIPIDRITPTFILESKNKISICQETYYEEIRIIWENGKPSICFGNEICIKLKNTDKPDAFELLSIGLEYKGTLKEQLRDIEFYKKLVDNKSIELNNDKITINFNNENINDEITKRKNWLDSISKKLKSLHIKEDLKLNLLNKEEYGKINYLLDINEVHKRDIDDAKPLRYIDIANIKILTFIKKEKQGYKIVDFYSSKIKLFAIDAVGKSHTVSQYISLQADDLISSNFVMETVYNDITNQKYNYAEQYLERVNLFLLEVIKAYELDTGKHDELKELMIKLSEWLINNKLSPHFLLNYYQIIKRFRSLTTEEENILKDIIEENSTNLEILAGANILLHNFELAKALLNELSADRVAVFKEFPIYRLMK